MARRKVRTRLVVGLAIVALGSLAFGTLSPSASGIVTTVSIAPKFQGLVNAQVPCRGGRTVVVKRFKRRAPDKEIGRTISAADGSWAVPSERQFGKYYAVAKKSIATDTGYGYSGATCERGVSPLLKIGSRPRPRR